MSDYKYYSCAGDPIEKEYILHDDGRIEVVGTHDLQAEIESYRDSVELKHIMDTCYSYDDPRLHFNKGIYMDTTIGPKTSSELSDLGKYNRRKISGLPPELRNLSLEDFMKLSSDDIVSIMDNSKNKNNKNNNIDINNEENKNE